MADNENLGAPQSRNEALLQNILGESYDLGAPQSRNEALLMKIAGEDVDVDFEPQSRIEVLLKEIIDNGGTGGGVEVESLSVTENGTYTAEQGKAYSPVTVDVQGSGGLYELGYQYAFQGATCFAKNNHFKVEFSSAVSSQSVHMHGYDMTMPLWFTVPVGSAVVRYYNIVSTGIKWNANAKKAGTNTSLTWGIGNDYHENEVIKERTIVTAEDVGNWFVYIESAPAGSILEFDMSLTVDGVRYI